MTALFPYVDTEGNMMIPADGYAVGHSIVPQRHFCPHCGAVVLEVFMWQERGEMRFRPYPQPCNCESQELIPESLLE